MSDTLASTQISGCQAAPAEKLLLGNMTERQLCAAAHISTLAGVIVPFGNFLGPLAIYFMIKDSSAAVKSAALESLNFQITLLIALIAAFILCFLFVGFLILPVIAIGGLVLIVMATIQSSEGKNYRYPFTLRLLKA